MDPEAARRGGVRAARLSLLAGRRFGRILWRRRLLVLGSPAVVLGLTTAYVATLPPLFQAATLVAMSDGRAGLEPRSAEPTAIPSQERDLVDQLPLVKSRAMAAQLIDRLDLQLSAEFNPRLGLDSAWGPDGRGALGLIPAALLDAPRETELTDAELAARLRHQIVDAVLPRIHAEPAGTSVLSLQFVAADPNLAAAGATALAELYLEDRREAWQQERQRERERLGEEVERLAMAIGATENAIAELRATSIAGPEQASEQDLLDLTGELAYWRNERAELEVRLGQVGGPLDSEASLDRVAQSLDPALLGKLRGREVELERELAELAQAHDEQDPQISGLRAELVALDDEKRFEVEQSLGQLEQEVALIRSREAALEARVETLRGRLAESRVVGDLETLERQAEADRELLRTYVARAEALESAPQAPELDARIVAPAVAPKEPSYPRLGLIYGTALGGALLLGGLLALGAEAWERARA